MEWDIEDTYQIREHKGDRKGKEKVGESSQRKPQNQQQRQHNQQYGGHSLFHGNSEEDSPMATINRVCYGCGVGDYPWRACPFRGASQGRFQSQGTS